jgi:hypothetical protein
MRATTAQSCTVDSMTLRSVSSPGSPRTVIRIEAGSAGSVSCA